jgi:hypothetical protein
VQQNEGLNAEPKDAAEYDDEEDRECTDEVNLYISRQFLYEAESEAYETLKDMQAITIPRVLAHTKVIGPHHNKDQDQFVNRYFEHPGLLWEHIEGIPLEDIAEHAQKMYGNRS